MILLGILLSYMLAFGVNAFFHYRMSDFTEYRVGDEYHRIEISNADQVDRIELVDTLMSIADEYEVLLNSGYIDALDQTFYFYGNSDFISKTHIGHLTRTKKTPIDLSDRALSINTFEEGYYGRVYTIGNFSHVFGDIRFYSFERMKDSFLSLSFSVSIYGDKLVVNEYISKLNESTIDVQVTVMENQPGYFEREPFAWREIFFNKIFITSILVVLLVLLGLIVITQKNRRFVSILKMHGYRNGEISRRLFGKYLLFLFAMFVFGCVFFDVLIVKELAFYNSIFYMIQLLLILAIAISLLVAHYVHTGYLKSYRVNESIKNKEISSSYFDLALVGKWFLIFIVFSFYLPSYKEAIAYSQANLHLRKNYQTMSSVSYIAGFNSNISIQDQWQIEEILNESFHDEEKYCIDSSVWSSESSWFGKRPQPPVTIDVVNVTFAKHYLDASIVKEIDFDKTTVIIPTRLEGNSQQKRFLKNQFRSIIAANQHDSYELFYVDRINEYYPTIYSIREKFKNKIVIVSNDYYKDKFYFPRCYFKEEQLGSTMIIDNVLEDAGISQIIITKTQKNDVDRDIINIQRYLVPLLFDSLMSLFLLIVFYIMLFTVYVDTYKKKIAVLRHLGYNTWQILVEYYLKNGVVYGSLLIVLTTLNSFSWLLVLLIITSITIEVLSLHVILGRNTKYFKLWIS